MTSLVHKVGMPPNWVYVSGVCEKSVKATSPSIACVSCYNWVHLKLYAKMKFKEAIEKQKTFQCSACLKKNTVGILIEVLFSESETKSSTYLENHELIFFFLFHYVAKFTNSRNDDKSSG